MDHERLDQLRRQHGSLRLLAAEHMPLIVSFLETAFVQPQRRALPQSTLVALLGDQLSVLARSHEGRYPRSARQYLEDWSAGTTPFLRKYYAVVGDEPVFDLTPATERAIEWLRSLEERAFIGTESRFLALFTQLEQLALLASGDRSLRISELETRRAQLDAELERVQAGTLDVLDATQIRERFFHIEDSARKLLADFRQVEQNFRTLDQQARERLALADQRGGALELIFSATDGIWSSDQGRSFTAFWEYLLSPKRQQQLDELLARCHALDAVIALHPGTFLKRLGQSLVGAAEAVHERTQRLVEQLRRLVADRQRLQQRQLLERIRLLERRLLTLRSQPPDARERAFHHLDAVSADIELPLERTLAQARRSSSFLPLVLDSAAGAVVDLEALYLHNPVDETLLATQIQEALASQSQIRLSALLERWPLLQGLAELVAYLKLASSEDSRFRAVVDDQRREQVQADGRAYELPEVVYCR